MGYSKETVAYVREQYAQKYKKARQEADARRAEVEKTVPEVARIHRALADIGLEAVHAAIGGGEDAAKTMASLKEQSLLMQEARAKLLRENGYPDKYLAVQYECELCEDTGYVDNHMCDCMKRALQMAGYEASGVASCMQEQTFDSFSLAYYQKGTKAYDQMELVYRTMRRYAERFSGGSDTNLVLFGGTGLGKTHLSTAVARTVIEKGFDVLYVSAVGLMAAFEKERFGHEAAGVSDDVTTTRCLTCDLLILDDLGTEINNQFTVSTLYHVINERLIRHKATIISTNLTPAEVRSRYWDRIASRIFGEYTPLMFEGTDVRMQKLQQPHA